MGFKRILKVKFCYSFLSVALLKKNSFYYSLLCIIKKCLHLVDNFFQPFALFKFLKLLFIVLSSSRVFLRNLLLFLLFLDFSTSLLDLSNLFLGKRRSFFLGFEFIIFKTLIVILLSSFLTLICIHHS